MGRFQSLYLPKVFASLSREEKRNKNLPKWCFSDPTPRTSKLLSTKTTTRSCCTSHLRSPTRHFWPALTPSGTPPGDGTRPSGADFPLPPRRPSGSSISTETLSRSSSDTSPSRTTGSDPSVRHRQTPSSFDRSIDISMMGANRRDYCFFSFFLEYMYFYQKKKKSREKATYFDIIICRSFL